MIATRMQGVHRACGPRERVVEYGHLVDDLVGHVGETVCRGLGGEAGGQLDACRVEHVDGEPTGLADLHQGG